MDTTIQQRVSLFSQRHRTASVTFVVTDLVGFPQLKPVLGDQAAVHTIAAQQALLRDLLGQFPDAEEIGTAGNAFFLLFARPPDAVRFALTLGTRRRARGAGSGPTDPVRLQDRIGVHTAGIVAQDDAKTVVATDLLRVHADLAARVMSLAQGGQVLMTRFAFDNARQALRGNDLDGIGPLTWLNHGSYRLNGVRTPVEICEVRPAASPAAAPPARSDQAVRVTAEGEPVPDWRTAVSRAAPGTECVLERDLGGWCADRGGPAAIPLEARLEIVAQVAEVLQAAHEAGVIHRNVTPGNILVTGSLPPTAVAERESHPPVAARLTGFGLGQRASPEGLAGPLGVSAAIPLTEASASKTGTQTYLAPEVVAGKPASTRSDLYSLGVVLFQFLVGDFSQPVTGDWWAAIDDALLRDDLRQCLAGRPEDRFAGAAQLAGNLRNWRERLTLSQRQKAIQAARERAAYHRGGLRAAALAALVVLLVTGLALVAWQESRQAQRETLNARHRLYAADMSLAGQALAEDNIGRTTELLRKQRPALGQTNADFRGWEWRYLWRATRGDEVSAPGHPPDTDTTGNDQASKPGNTSPLPARRCWTGPAGEVVLTRLARDGTRLFVVATDATGSLIDTRTLTEVARRPLPFIIPHPDALAVAGQASASAIAIAVAAPNGCVSLWDPATDKAVRLTEPGVPVARLAFSADSQALAIVRTNQSVEVWEVARSRPLANIELKEYRVSRALALADGAGHLAVGYLSGTVAIWDLQTRQPIRHLRGHDQPVTDIDLAPDGTMVAASSADGKVTLWDAATGRVRATLGGLSCGFPCVTFSRDGRRLAAGADDGSVILWDLTLSDPPEVARLRDSKRRLGTVLFLPDHETLVGVSSDRTGFGGLFVWQATPVGEDPPRSAKPTR